jgi:hypothetical protein
MVKKYDKIIKKTLKNIYILLEFLDNNPEIIIIYN